MANVSSCWCITAETPRRNSGTRLGVVPRRRRQTHARALPRRCVARRFRRTMGRLPRFFRPLRRERRQGDVPRRHLRVTDDHLVARVHAGDAPRSSRDVYERTPTLSRACNRAGNRAHAKTRAELAASVTRLYGARRAAFDEEDIRTALVVADALARAPEPWPRDGSRNAKPNSNLGQSYAAEETQRACLALVANLAPLDDAATDAGLYPRALRQLLSYAEEAAKGDGRGTRANARARRRSRRNPRRRVTRSARRRARRSRTCTETRGSPRTIAPRRSARRRGYSGRRWRREGKARARAAPPTTRRSGRSATRAMAVAMAHGLPAVHKYARPRCAASKRLGAR